MTAAPDSPESAPNREQARLLLDGCFEQYRAKLVDIATASIDLSGDLFEGNSYVSENDVNEFKSRRTAWVQRFDEALRQLYERRMGGVRRKGRRADFDASLATLKVLTAFDQEKQAALVAGTAFLLRLTRRELDALDLRVDTLMPGEALRDFDNPFSPPYMLDAIGMTARATYPNPRIWRAFMERVVADLSPAANKVYITLNRYLADHGVLPEIKAALRARSEFRPTDDKDLIPTFSKMLHDALSGLPTDVAVPNLEGGAGGASVFDFGGAGERAEAAVAALLPSAIASNADDSSDAVPVPGVALTAGFVTLGQEALTSRPRAASDDGLFPDLDPLMSLGTSTPLFNTLGHLQRKDLPTELARVIPGVAAAGGAAMVPLNLIPHIRAAMSGQIANPTDRITMDVIALLFDYIFRDPSISPSLRKLFGRLQVPVLKAALLDRTFFSDRSHAARKLLDHLADAAVGATHGAEYESALEQKATGVVDQVCLDFEIDVKVFADADAVLQQFIEGERRRTESSMQPEVAAALAAEEGESDRAEVRALMRDKLAGLALPFEVRSFVETTWADYLAAVRRDRGPESTEWIAALHTLDDLLWSIVAKDRTAQKARLTRMIPTLVVGLRKGCAAVNVPQERSKPFFDALYPLHVAAIKPATTTNEAVETAGPATLQPATGTARGRPTLTRGNVHDFVSEMAVGTWLAFAGEGKQPTINARLSWVSPLRTKYLFTSRARGEALMLTPEELAWQIAAGRASLVLEPVALFDRAVSAALDSLAAQRPADTQGKAA